MPSLRIVALSVIILGSLACSEEQSTTTTVTTGADVCVDDANVLRPDLLAGRFAKQMPRLSQRARHRTRDRVRPAASGTACYMRPIKRSSPICRA